jgi:hypothetical protein
MLCFSKGVIMDKIICFLCTKEIDPKHEEYQSVLVSQFDDVTQEDVCNKCAEKAKYDKTDKFYSTIVLGNYAIEKNEEKL